MRSKKVTQFLIPLLLTALLLAIAPPSARAASEVNRFNVSIIVDASGSMKRTDPENLRFAAIRLFMSLLTEEGNVVGGVVFSTGIDAEIPLRRIRGQDDKDRIVGDLEAPPANGQWTNIGEALMTSVRSLIRDGDPTKDSVIIFLSDGNTDMGGDREDRASIERQAEAIQLAREQHIDIYSVCLNVNGAADTDEMRRISNREDFFRNVSSASDLWNVFNDFHSMIYGSSTINIADERFPEDGKVDKTFYVPGVGVEEVNIIIYGNLTALEIKRPDGTIYPEQPLTEDFVTTLKITNPQRGTWKLHSEGVKQEHIKIDMKKNSDMVVVTEVSPPESENYTAGETQTVTSTLKSGERLGSAESYQDYTAELRVTDAQGNTVSVDPMEIDGASFQKDVQLPEGTYSFTVVIVDKAYGEAVSEDIGPITVGPQANHPPAPVQETVSDNITVWPIKNQPYQLDLKTLATDPDEDDKLTYTVTESSFLAGEDYTIDENQVLTLRQFGHLTQGMFEIKATDSKAESCTIRVNLHIRFVTRLAAAGLAIAALLAVIVLLLLIWRSFGMAFMGKMTVTNIKTGDRYSIPLNRGRVRLRDFDAGDTGLSGRCYFQATGRNYVNFIVPPLARPVYVMGRRTRRVRLESDFDTEIFAEAENMERGINVYFKSDLDNDGME